MKAERRAYPSRKDDDSKGLSSMIDAELTDLLDEDEEERLEKQKLSARRKINAPSQEGATPTISGPIQGHHAAANPHQGPDPVRI